MQKLYFEKRFSEFREIINNSANIYGNRTAFEIKINRGRKLKISYREFRQRFYTMCSQFLKSELHEKRIAIVGQNSFEWVLSYLAAATAGVAVPLDKELQASDISSFTDSAECAAICTADNKAGSISTDKMQVLIFTSGTTGNAKGVCLSQFAICSDIYSTVQAVKIKSNDVTLSVLPLHHTYECTLNCLLLLSRGAEITYCDGLTKIQKNMTEYRPTVLIVVPALLKVLDRRIHHAVAKECPKKIQGAV